MAKKIPIGCKVCNAIFRIFPSNIKDKQLISCNCGIERKGVIYPFYFVKEKAFLEYHNPQNNEEVLGGEKQKKNEIK